MTLKAQSAQKTETSAANIDSSVVRDIVIDSTAVENSSVDNKAQLSQQFSYRHAFM